MNAKKAKRIRKSVYGDMSIRTRRRYVYKNSGTIMNHPADLRAKYQEAKKAA